VDLSALLRRGVPAVGRLRAQEGRLRGREPPPPPQDGPPQPAFRPQAVLRYSEWFILHSDPTLLKFPVPVPTLEQRSVLGGSEIFEKSTCQGCSKITEFFFSLGMLK
jgi:hypothetical protein